MSSSEPQPTVSFITLSDGTRFGYREVSGPASNSPGLVIVSGAVCHSRSHTDLAFLLCKHFTVYMPDRLGRGLSQHPDFTFKPSDTPESLLSAEVSSIRQLISHTHAKYIVSVSSGAVLTLQLLLDQAKSAANLKSDATSTTATPLVTKAAIFEPPLMPNGFNPAKQALYKRFESELASNSTSAALISAMLLAEMGPAWFHRMPRALLNLLQLVIWMERKPSASDPDPIPTMTQLAPALKSDFGIVKASANQEFLQQLEHHVEPMLQAGQLKVLLCSGDQSPEYLRSAVKELTTVLKGAQAVEWHGDHGILMNRVYRGKPESTASDLIGFFEG